MNERQSQPHDDEGAQSIVALRANIVKRGVSRCSGIPGERGYDAGNRSRFAITGFHGRIIQRTKMPPS